MYQWYSWENFEAQRRYINDNRVEKAPASPSLGSSLKGKRCTFIIIFDSDDYDALDFWSLSDQWGYCDEFPQQEFPLDCMAEPHVYARLLAVAHDVRICEDVSLVGGAIRAYFKSKGKEIKYQNEQLRGDKLEEAWNRADKIGQK